MRVQPPQPASGVAPAQSGDCVHLLLIEDNPLDARLVEETLVGSQSVSFVSEWVTTLAAACERLDRQSYDLILMDLSLPDSLGLAGFERVQQAAPETALIVLSGVSDEAVALKALQDGAQDYVVKGTADSALLVRLIRYALERKRIEWALEQEQELFRTLMDNIPDNIYFKDQQSRFVRLNRVMAQRCGFAEPAAAVGLTDYDLFSAAHAEQALADEQAVMRTGQPIVGKLEAESRPDGSHQWVLTTKMARRDKFGRVLGTFGISRDVTELKQMEEVLETERNRLRALIDALPDHIYVKDAASRFLLCNRAVADYFGLRDPGQIVGMWDFDFFPREQARRFYDEEQQLMRSAQSQLNRENVLVDGAGQTRWLLTTKVVMRNGHQQATGLVGINRDITAQKDSTQRLSQLNADLARSQLELLGTYEDLKKSNEALKATQLHLIQAAKMESVGRLAAGVAHEVKNPLAILLMGVEYLGETLRDGNQDVLMTLAQMTEAVKRADGIVRGLLDFSASAELKLAPTDLNGAVEQSLVLVRHALRERRVQVVRELATGLPLLTLDRLKIEQVLINLFMNAAQAMTKGGQLLVHTTQPLPGRVEVIVEDTGPGIPPELLPRVFEPFYTTKPSGAGTGLGLSVARNIIEWHNGELHLANREQGGVRVTITFNQAKEPHASPQTTDGR